jgi:PAS domain S-box-containing protein
VSQDGIPQSRTDRSRFRSPQPPIRSDLSNPDDPREQVPELRARNEELRRIQLELEESRQRYFDLFNLAPVGYFSLDENSRIVEANLTAARMLGRPGCELVGSPLSSYLTQGSAHGLRLQCRRVVESGEAQSCEVRLWKVDGSLMDLRLESARAEENGIGIRFRVAAIDITDQKEAERRLRETHQELERGIQERREGEQALQEQRMVLQTILNSIPVMILFFDASGKVNMVNREFERLIGWSVEEARHVDILRECYPDPAAYREIAEFMAGAEAGWRDFRIRTRPGAYLENAWSTVRLPDGSQIGIGIDITRRKQTERRILQYQKKLRGLAAELSYSSRRERQRLALDLHDRIGQSLLLSKMRLGMMKMDQPTGGLSRETAEIGTLLDRVIQDTRALILELYPPILQHIGLGPAVSALAGEMERRHGLPIRLDDDGEAKPLDEDVRIFLYRAVGELLLNVVRHARAGAARIGLRRDRDRARLTVEDDGQGFTPQEEESDPGLGLFRIREELGSLGGTLEIDTRPGGGTRVTMSVPLSNRPGAK